MMEFYILNNNVKEGPLSIEALATKKLTPDTLVWTVGYREWRLAKNVPELNDVLYSTPPAPPAPLPMPKTWLVESILVTLFCCLPLGIVGIVNAVKVDTLYYAGQYDEALYRSTQAKKWIQWGFYVGLAGLVIYGILLVVSSIVDYL